jgi:Transglutaminase-like superfamily
LSDNGPEAALTVSYKLVTLTRACPKSTEEFLSADFVLREAQYGDVRLRRFVATVLRPEYTLPNEIGRMTMNRPIPTIFLALLVLISQIGCVLLPFTSKKISEPVRDVKGYASVGKLPFKEAWYGMYFQGDKVGFSHFRIEPSGRNFKITNESLMRLVALKKTNETSSKDKIIVRPDLSLVSFESRVLMNDKELRMTGRVEGDTFLLDMEVEGEKLRRKYPLGGRKLYHNSAVSLFPAINGISNGKQYSIGVFNPEKQGMEYLDQQIFSVVGKPGPNDAVWKAKTKYGKSEVYSWLNRKGLVVLEKMLDGSLITILEDEDAADKFLKSKGSSKDLVLDYSLIRVSKPIPNPEETRFLKVKIKGIETSLIPGDHRQKVNGPDRGAKEEGFDVTIQTEPIESLKGQAEKRSASYLQDYLAPTMAVQCDHEEIRKQARQIVSPGDSDLVKVKKLVGWTSTNIKSVIKDSFSALSVLRSGEGECQAHANLYAAMARAEKIPTRVVTGLVFTKDVGFLYHAWAESYLNGWVAVDPTLGQLPADATHIKIATGETANDVGAVLKMVGKVKVDVLEYK